MTHIGEEYICNVDYPELINALVSGFNSTIETPLRSHFNFKNTGVKDSTLLIMPSWKVGERLGIKLVTVSPENSKLDLPSIHGQYILFDAINGKPISMLDGKMLTTVRTAAVSAMASKYLSREDSKTLLMIGTGSLAPELIRAHSSVRPIEKVFIWGRNRKKSEQLASNLSIKGVSISVTPSVEEALENADIVSSATLSEAPIIRGELLKEGQHLDLVGAYQPHMRESDDLCIQKASIFLDTMEAGLKESGDIAIPLSKGILKKEEIKGHIEDLTSNAHPGRVSKDEITLFKSVGHASEDLIAANYFYDRLTQ